MIFLKEIVFDFWKLVFCIFGIVWKFGGFGEILYIRIIIFGEFIFYMELK
jgi:hypothetical protein